MILAKQLAQSLKNFNNSNKEVLHTLNYYKNKNLIVKLRHSEILNVATAAFSDRSFMYLEFIDDKTKITAMPEEDIECFLLKQVLDTYQKASLKDDGIAPLDVLLSRHGLDIPEELLKQAEDL